MVVNSGLVLFMIAAAAVILFVIVMYGRDLLRSADADEATDRTGTTCRCLQYECKHHE